MPRYVTTDELYAVSGLSRVDLGELEAAALLTPPQTNPAPCYRLRPVNWARKLAYLQREGWLDDIGAWARTVRKRRSPAMAAEVG